MEKLYQPVPLDEENTHLFGYPKVQTRVLRETDQIRGALHSLTDKWIWLVHAILLSASLTLFTVTMCAGRGQLNDLYYTQRYSSYSPVAPIVKYENIRYNLTPKVEGPFVGYGPEVDKQWSRVADNMGDIMITQDELDRLGLPKDSLKLTDPKTGKEGYRAAIEVFHQLHCLNLIRQFAHKEYYETIYSDISHVASKEDLFGHVEHCIETLRINLMCTGDIGIFTFRTYPEYGYADDDYWPDFSTKHTCRNFEDILQWGYDNTVAWDHSV